MNEEASHPFAIRNATDAEKESLIRALRVEPAGVEIDRDAVYHVQCGRAEVLVVLAATVMQGPSLRDAFGTSRLAGVAFARRPDGDAPPYSPLVFALADPSGSADGVELSIIDGQGKLIYAGSGEVRREELAFSIRGVAGYGVAPVDVAGVLGRGGLALHRTTVGARVARKRSAGSSPTTAAAP